MGIHFKLLKFEETLFNDKHIGWDIEICFWGANHPKNEQPKFSKDCHTKIWCEFRFYEKIIFPMEERKLIHLFSDGTDFEINIPCYSVQEVLAEKMRALIQRNRGEARDYFDLWYIKTHVNGIESELVKEAFYQKCAYKNISFTGAEDFFKPERLKQVEITWEKRLSHQLPEKVNRIHILDDLKIFFYSLFQTPNP